MLYNQFFGASLSGIVTEFPAHRHLRACLVFAIIELLALWMAIRLSRTITASVADLYSATQHIDRGDLNYRIGVTRTDQLAELSRSFNTMTGSLQRLLVEQKEKERLQNEISIAQEVQANLFPLRAQGLETLELHGVCRPARSVSGDYYDFLVFHEEAHNGISSRKETGVGIAIGDISGKGISAALLMATLHSAVRAYRFASEELIYSRVQRGRADGEQGRVCGGDCDELFQSPGRILSLLNRHLYRSTQPEKYATLFLAHYDASLGEADLFQRRPTAAAGAGAGRQHSQARSGRNGRGSDGRHALRRRQLPHAARRHPRRLLGRRHGAGERLRRVRRRAHDGGGQPATATSPCMSSRLRSCSPSTPGSAPKSSPTTSPWSWPAKPDQLRKPTRKIKLKIVACFSSRI